MNPHSMEHCGGCGQRCSGVILPQTQSQTIRAGVDRKLAFVFKELPKALDTDDVTVTVELFGDFAESDKYADVSIAGEIRERIRGEEPVCNWIQTPAHRGHYRVASALLVGGELSVEVTLSQKVSLVDCASFSTRVVVTLSYGGQICCNQRCIQPKETRDHCGQCGRNCEGHVCCAGRCCQPHEVCQEGQCVLEIQPIAGWVHQIAFHPSQPMLALATSGGGQLVDLSSRQVVANFHQKSQVNVLSVAIHPQGNPLATASTDGLVQLWSIPAVNASKIVHTYQKPATSVAFSPDGKWLASCSAEGKVHLWDAVSGKQMWEYTFGGVEMTALAFHPQGQSIFVHAGYTFLLILDLKGTVLKAINMARYSSTNVLSFAIRPDGQQVAIGMWSQEIHILDTSTYNPLKVLLHPGLPQQVSYDASGQWLAVASNNKAVWVWDMNRRQIEHSFFGHSSSVTSVQFHPQSLTIVSGGAVDKVLRLWRVPSP